MGGQLPADVGEPLILALTERQRKRQWNKVCEFYDAQLDALEVNGHRSRNKWARHRELVLGWGMVTFAKRWSTGEWWPS